MRFGVNDFNDLKDLFKQIVGYETWKLTNLEKLIVETQLFFKIASPSLYYSMEELSLSLVIVKIIYIGVPYFLS